MRRSFPDLKGQRIYWVSCYIVICSAWTHQSESHGLNYTPEICEANYYPSIGSNVARQCQDPSASWRQGFSHTHTQRESASACSWWVYTQLQPTQTQISRLGWFCPNKTTAKEDTIQPRLHRTSPIYYIILQFNKQLHKLLNNHTKITITPHSPYRTNYQGCPERFHPSP